MLIGGTPRVAHPAVDAAPARKHPQDVLKPKVLPQAGIQHLLAAQAQPLCNQALFHAQEHAQEMRGSA